MRHLPLFHDLRGRAVLVVGGGAVAARKVALLLPTGAAVRVLAPELESELSTLRDEGRVQHLRESFRAQHLDDVHLVIAADGDRSVDRAVADAAQARRIPVNVVDDLELSSAILPAVVDRSPLLVAISTGGASPVLARLLRERIESVLQPGIAQLLVLAERWRARVQQGLATALRRRFWSDVLRGRVARLVAAQRVEDAERALGAQLSHWQRGEQRAEGSVALVGAGPGDPELLTLKALRLLQEADVVLYDRLVAAPILELIRRDALRIDVGKLPGDHRHSQAQIHLLLIEHARAGHRVVRLKGGDPFVFGRGGEELEALAAAGIAYEVVPGITAALACAAYSGIPLTHRDHAQSVRFVTAHCQRSLDTLDWQALAAERQTLAFYMGAAQLDHVRDRLVAHGRAAATPFAIVENGSRPEQRVITGTLANLPERARAHAVQAPALLIVGEVAALAEQLAWFGSPPIGEAYASALAA